MSFVILIIGITVYQEQKTERALEALDGGWSIGDTAPEPTPLVLDRIAR